MTEERACKKCVIFLKKATNVAVDVKNNHKNVVQAQSI